MIISRHWWKVKFSSQLPWQLIFSLLCSGDSLTIQQDEIPFERTWLKLRVERDFMSWISDQVFTLKLKFPLKSFNLFVLSQHGCKHKLNKLLSLPLINEQTWPFYTISVIIAMARKMWNIANPLYVPWKHFILFVEFWRKEILISL